MSEFGGGVAGGSVGDRGRGGSSPDFRREFLENLEDEYNESSGPEVKEVTVVWKLCPVDRLLWSFRGEELIGS